MKQNKIKIVAEAGCNHNGNIKMAFKLVDAAKKSKRLFLSKDTSVVLTKGVPDIVYSTFSMRRWTDRGLRELWLCNQKIVAPVIVPKPKEPSTKTQISACIMFCVGQKRIEIISWFEVTNPAMVMPVMTIRPNQNVRVMKRIMPPFVYLAITSSSHSKGGFGSLFV